MAVTATFNFSSGTLSIFGDTLANSIVASRSAAGSILVNGGAISVQGGLPTVTNTKLIQVFSQGGNDTLTLDETNGALPETNFFGGAHDDTGTGGSGHDLLFGQTGGDTLFGKGGADFLFGGDDNDTLDGGGGDDQLFGEAGEDTLDGGIGADKMTGGAEGDTYFVDSLSDVIIETAGNGITDWVKASATFDLLAGVDVEMLSTIDDKGTATTNLYGNELAQTIIGNAGANILSDGGKGGSDTLIGLDGNDIYKIYNADTVVTEGAAEGATDAVLSAVSYTLKAGVEVEVLTTTGASATGAISLYGNAFNQSITGNAGANSLRGYGGDDTINGGDGADKISGGTGNDMLSGNAGADTYYFSYALNGSTNVDKINGFSSIDLISLNASIFTKAGPVGVLDAAAFVGNTSGAAADASDRIIYETDTGILRYDSDGTGAGAGVAFAIIENKFALSAGDFVIA